MLRWLLSILWFFEWLESHSAAINLLLTIALTAATIAQARFAKRLKDLTEAAEAERLSDKLFVWLTHEPYLVAGAGAGRYGELMLNAANHSPRGIHISTAVLIAQDQAGAAILVPEMVMHWEIAPFGSNRESIQARIQRSFPATTPQPVAYTMSIQVSYTIGTELKEATSARYQCSVNQAGSHGLAPI